MSSTEQIVERTTKAKNTSKRTLILVLIAFALPVILAKLALEQHWLDYGVTNNGKLIEQELTLAQLGLLDERFNEQWLVMYIMPEQCNTHCENTLENVHNSYVALGKEMPRVTPVLVSQTLTELQKTRISTSQWQVIPSTDATKANIDHPQILIADPQGNVFLSHEIPLDTVELVPFGKLIVADMKKLLKYSRIG